MLSMLIQAQRSNNYLVTVAIGSDYFDCWKKYAYPFWLNYCQKHGLGLLALTESLFDSEDVNWKKPNWQKLLLGSEITKNFSFVENACFLDTDILISPNAPNIFDSFDGHSYGLISKVKNLPMSLDAVTRKFVFLRHHFYDQDYPLDSAAFMTAEQQYNYSGLTPFDDLACTGVFLFSPKEVAEEMAGWYFKYDKDYISITGGEQVHLNWEILNSKKVQWLPYEFQAIWVYEMAWKYPFLYYGHGKDNDLIRNCISASLFSNHFLHFAGSWYESDMWKLHGLLGMPISNDLFQRFESYCAEPVTGTPVGPIKPTR